MLYHVEPTAGRSGPRRSIGKRLQHVPARRAVADWPERTLVSVASPVLALLASLLVMLGIYRLRYAAG